jgi:SulP family sulfate permease
VAAISRKTGWKAYLPLLADLKRGDRAQITQDGLAGTITAILLIPQALAYALLAGLPPEIGLYASILPVLVYALLGSSRTLAVGPVAVAAMLFTGLLATLPKSVLAAIIVVAVWQLVDFGNLRHTWRYDRGDGLAQLATIAGVLTAGVETGLMIGAGLSLLLFLYRTSRPHIAVIGRLGDTEHYRNVLRHEVRTWPGLLLVRVDETLYFANAPRVESELQARIIEADQPSDVVLVMSGVAYVDTSGLEVLEALEVALSRAGSRLHLAEVKGPVMDRLAGTDLLERLGSGRVHLSADDAVIAIRGGDTA